MLRTPTIALTIPLLAISAWAKLIPERERVVAPDWSLKDARGALVGLADFRGRVLLLDYWATWCGPSTVEMPWFSGFSQQYASRGLAVVGVSVDDDWDIAMAYVHAKSIQYPILGADDTTLQKYDVEALPTTVIIDQQGHIAARYVALTPGLELEIENDLRTLLPPAQSSRPKVLGVVNAASLRPGVSSGAWITISGENLAPVSRSWNAGDFVGGKLPSQLDGVRVSVNGKPAFPAFISPTQINALTPQDDPGTGSTQVVVSSSAGTSDSFVALQQTYMPAFFTLPADGKYLVTQVGGALIGPGGLIPGLETRPAKTGDVVTLYGTGFGPARAPDDSLFSAPMELPVPVRIFIGSVLAEVRYAGLISNGLCQFNVVVPPLTSGSYSVMAEIGGVRSPEGPNLIVE